MALRTKPRWDKYDAYVGNPRGHLAADIHPSDYNKVLGVGYNSDGAIVVGSGQTGIKGLMIVAVGIDMHGELLDGGINNKAGDPQDVGKHGEITNFEPSAITNTYGITVVTGSGTFTVKTKNDESGDEAVSDAIAFNGNAAAVKTGIVGADDSLDAADVTVTGTAPNFVVTLPDGYSLVENDATADVVVASTAALAGTNYYAHADGSVTAVKGSDGIYVGHTVEASRLIVNVIEATP